MDTKKIANSSAAADVMGHTSAEEDFLCTLPQISFFRPYFQQSTKYVHQLMKLKREGTARFGDSVDFTPEFSDLLGRVYFVFKFPGIRHRSERFRDLCDDSDSSSKHDSSSDDRKEIPHKKFVYWNNSIAHIITQKVTFMVDGYPITPQTGEWYEHEDLINGKPGSTDEIVGRYSNIHDLWMASRKPQERVVRARFHFCEDVSKALQLFKIHKKTAIKFHLDLRNLEDCFVSSDKSQPYLMHEDCPLRDTDIQVEAYGDVYTLSKAERAQIYNEDSMHLMHQVYELPRIELPNSKTAHKRTHRIKIDLNRPITAIRWAIQQDKHIKNKEFYNYHSNHHGDTVDSAFITINNLPLDCEQKGYWWRNIPYIETKTNVPNIPLYQRHFAHNPTDETVHSGFLNGSAGEIVVNIRLTEHLDEKVFARFWVKTVNFMATPRSGKISVGWLDRQQ